MKKKLAILLSLAMVITFALAACGSAAPEETSVPEAQAAAQAIGFAM